MIAPLIAVILYMYIEPPPSRLNDKSDNGVFFYLPNYVGPLWWCFDFGITFRGDNNSMFINIFYGVKHSRWEKWTFLWTCCLDKKMKILPLHEKSLGWMWWFYFIVFPKSWKMHDFRRKNPTLKSTRTTCWRHISCELGREDFIFCPYVKTIWMTQ